MSFVLLKMLIKVVFGNKVLNVFVLISLMILFFFGI